MNPRSKCFSSHILLSVDCLTGHAWYVPHTHLVIYSLSSCSEYASTVIERHAER